jgi:hypothetical protein
MESMQILQNLKNSEICLVPGILDKMCLTCGFPYEQSHSPLSSLVCGCSLAGVWDSTMEEHEDRMQRRHKEPPIIQRF